MKRLLHSAQEPRDPPLHTLLTLQQFLQRTPLFNVKFYFLSRGLRSFGFPDHIRNPISGHSPRCMFQPLLQTNLQVPQNPHTPTGKCKACLPFKSLARKEFIWNQNMVLLRTSLKTMLYNQCNQIKENLSSSSTTPASTVTCWFELHLVLLTIHYASHEQLWCQLLNSPEPTPTSVWHKSKREQDLSVIRHQTKPTHL